MASREYTVFETSIGRVGIAWAGDGVVAVQLPGAGELKTIARLTGKAGAEKARKTPPFVRDAITRITRHLEGKPADLASIPVSHDRVPPFHRRVYESLRSIESGRTVTYGELAALAGSP